MAAYGAHLELVDGDMETARARADELEAEGAIQLGQFDNPANPEAHYRTTGEEIVEQVGDREVDAFVAGVGTGRTISGLAGGSARRSRDGDRRSRTGAKRDSLDGRTRNRRVPGMGPGFVSENLDRELIDRVETVRLEDAEDECRRLAREEGVLVGQSSGATSLVSQRIAREIAEPDLECPEVSTAFDGGQPASSETDGGAVEDCPLVVTVFWDSGERYLSTGCSTERARLDVRRPNRYEEYSVSVSRTTSVSPTSRRSYSGSSPSVRRT